MFNAFAARLARAVVGRLGMEGRRAARFGATAPRRAYADPYLVAEAVADPAAGR